VMLDLTMPVMSGKDAFCEIHLRWPSLPVAICTGYVIDIKQWAVSSSDTPPFLLQKPYSVAELTNFLAGASNAKGVSTG
jgi:CheY-like chemotaxis protein